MKKKNARILTLVCAAALCVTAFAGCTKVTGNSSSSADSGAKPLSGKTLKVATSATFPPFESVTVDAKGATQIEGFDMDVLKAMSKDLGFTYTIDNMDFSGLIGALQSGHDDLVISGISATDERKKSVDFTDSYFTSKTALIEKKGGTVTDTKTMKGKKIAASFGTQYETLAKASGADVTSLDSGTLVIQEVLNGRVDAGITDAAKATVLVKQYPTLDYHVIPSAELGSTVTNAFSIACPKNSTLVSAFNTEIQKLKENGTINKLTLKWMGADYLKTK